MSSFSVDALKIISKSRFELVLYLSQRAKDIGLGAKPLVGSCSKPSDKPVLVAYEEIARGLIQKGELEESLIRRLVAKENEDSVSSQFYGDDDRQSQMQERLRNSADAVFYGDDIEEKAPGYREKSDDDAEIGLDFSNKDGDFSDASLMSSGLGDEDAGIEDMDSAQSSDANEDEDEEGIEAEDEGLQAAEGSEAEDEGLSDLGLGDDDLDAHGQPLDSGEQIQEDRDPDDLDSADHHQG